MAILLATFNGERFLAEQLDSIAAQSHRNWVVYASDDGSGDGTLEILRRYRSQWGEERLHLLPGPRQGFARNFMSLLKRDGIEADYIAFCDQDDIWFEDKIERSLERLQGAAAGTPALFCSRTRLVDSGGRVIGLSPLFDREPGFRNALVQSLAGANTMLMNRPAWELLRRVPDDVTVVSHDWLAYLMVAGCGGRVFYDAEPTLDYRQHGRNEIGAGPGWRARLQRTREMLCGAQRTMNEHNLSILRTIGDRLSEDNVQVLDSFCQARNSRVWRRLCLLQQLGLYRQTVFGSVSLIIAAAMGRL